MKKRVPRARTIGRATTIRRAASRADADRRTVRYAVVGLGYISQAAVLPAFAHAGNSELTALVSDDPVKLKKLGAKFRVPHCYSYEEYDACLRSGEIDAVYIALPNDMHRDYTERAAHAGVHVLCEKPMAVTAVECEAMIRAARDAGVKLMIAYRLHFEQANMEVVELARKGRLGDLRLFTSAFTMQVEKGNIRLQRERGGGTLYDIGIYCINAARYLFRDEPEEVVAFSARSDDERFGEVDEMTSAILRFPHDRLAAFTSSFGAADVSAYELVGTKGRVRVDPAYEYAEPLAYTLTIDGRTRKRSFPKRDQFAPELIYFSECVTKNVDPQPSGHEGLADVRIIEALYRSAERGVSVDVEPVEPAKRPTLAHVMQRPGIEKPSMVHAAPPSGGA